MIWDTSIWRLACSNRSKIPSAQKCYLCLRYVVSPMSPGRTFVLWRRRRDSNPRDPFESNGFQDRRFQPLTHSSVFNSNLIYRLAAKLHFGFELLRFGARCSSIVAVAPNFPTATTLEARFDWVKRIATVSPSTNRAAKMVD